MTSLTLLMVLEGEKRLLRFLLGKKNSEKKYSQPLDNQQLSVIKITVQNNYHSGMYFLSFQG